MVIQHEKSTLLEDWGQDNFTWNQRKRFATTTPEHLLKAYLARVKTEKIFGERAIYIHPTLNKSYTAGNHRPLSELHIGLSCAPGLRAAEPLERHRLCVLWAKTSTKSCLAPPTSVGWISPLILKTQVDWCKNKKLQGFFCVLMDIW